MCKCLVLKWNQSLILLVVRKKQTDMTSNSGKNKNKIESHICVLYWVKLKLSIRRFYWTGQTNNWYQVYLGTYLIYCTFFFWVDFFDGLADETFTRKAHLSNLYIRYVHKDSKAVIDPIMVVHTSSCLRFHQDCPTLEGRRANKSSWLWRITNSVHHNAVSNGFWGLSVKIFEIFFILSWYLWTDLNKISIALRGDVKRLCVTLTFDQSKLFVWPLLIVLE